MALYPEGAINADPSAGLATFRYGAFKQALARDALLWSFVTLGHEQIWPKKVVLSYNYHLL